MMYHQHWAFQLLMYLESLSIFLAIAWFLSSEICSFLYMNPMYILLDLFKTFIFHMLLQMALLFQMLLFIVVYREIIDFCILICTLKIFYFCFGHKWAKKYKSVSVFQMGSGRFSIIISLNAWWIQYRPMWL